MRRNLIWASAIALSIVMSSYAQADIIFDFSTDAAETALDTAPGGTFQATDGTDTVSLTSVSFVALEIDPEPDPAVLTGNTIVADSNLTNDGWGINNPSATNTPAAEATGAANESSTISGGEVLVFNLDTDVVFTEIDFFGIGGSETAEITIGGNAFSFANGQSADVFADPFGAGFVVAAGTNIEITAGANAHAFALTDFSVNVVAVPEPSSFLILSGLGLLAFRRRR